MFEQKHQPLISHIAFLARLVRSFLVTLVIVGFSLLFGGAGYHYLGHLDWVDAFLNAAMILTGMGPVDKMESTAGKLFAICYSLYSGIAFLTMISVLMAPVFHRALHSFHVEEETNENDAAATAPNPSARK